MPTTLFIDLDSTLVENQFSRKALGTPLEEIAAASGQTLQQLVQALRTENERRQREDPDHPLTMDWDNIIEALARRYGVRLSQRGIDLWHRYAHADDVTVLDNAPQVLARLREMGYRLVLATKGLSKYQLPVLHVTGLDQWFEEILTPDRTGSIKTNPAYYARYTLVRGRGDRFIQIGDHYYDDVICARRCGFQTVLRAPLAALAAVDPLERPAHLAQVAADIPTYPPQGTRVRPDAVVISLEELPEVLPRLEALPQFVG